MKWLMILAASVLLGCAGLRQAQLDQIDALTDSFNGTPCAETVKEIVAEEGAESIAYALPTDVTIYNEGSYYSITLWYHSRYSAVGYTLSWGGVIDGCKHSTFKVAR